jgi:hypothetical protein
MARSRPLVILLAMACVGAMTLGGGVASASPAAPTPAPAAAAGGRLLLPSHVFSPYVGPSNHLTAIASASGAKYLTLDFLQTPRPGSCTVDWNGSPTTPVGTYGAAIAALQAAGGQVVPSLRRRVR